MSPALIAAMKAYLEHHALDTSPEAITLKAAPETPFTRPALLKAITSAIDASGSHDPAVFSSLVVPLLYAHRQTGNA